MAKLVAFDNFARPDESSGIMAANMILEGNAIAQLSELPDGDGFLIRLWPKNGTHEFGGSNITDFSAVLKLNDDGHFRISHLHADGNFE